MNPLFQGMRLSCKGDRVQVQALTAGGDDNTTARNFMKTGGDDYFLAYVNKGGSVKEDQVTHTTRLMYIMKVTDSKYRHSEQEMTSLPPETL